MEIIRSHRPLHVLVLAGDHIYKMDYGPMIGFHVENEADITVGVVEVPRDRARDFGVLTVDESNRVVRFQEKPLDPGADARAGRTSRSARWASTSSIPSCSSACCAPTAEDPASAHDFGKNIIPDAIENLRVYAYPFEDVRTKAQNYWRDVGTVEAYYEANMELVRVSPELNIYDEQWPIWTYQEQLPPAKFVFDEDDRRGAAIDSMVSGGCIISGSRVSNSLLCSNVRVHDRSTIDRSVILPRVRMGEHCVIQAGHRRRRSARSGRHRDRRGPGRRCGALPRDGGRHRARDFGYAQVRVEIRLTPAASDRRRGESQMPRLALRALLLATLFALAACSTFGAEARDAALESRGHADASGDMFSQRLHGARQGPEPERHRGAGRRASSSLRS